RFTHRWLARSAFITDSNLARSAAECALSANPRSTSIAASSESGSPPCSAISLRRFSRCSSRASRSSASLSGPITRSPSSPGRPAGAPPARAPPGGGREVDLPQVLPGHQRIDLGGRHARVAEQLLDDPHVRAPLEQVGRERVPERVRADPLADAGAGGVLLDDPRASLAGQ